jgi:hypothetical protein
LKSHVTTKVGEVQSLVFCKKHDKKEIEIHCRTCNEDICTLCSIKGHKGHDVDALIDFADSCREDVAKSAEELSVRANKLLALKQEVSDSLEQVKQVPSQCQIRLNRRWLTLLGACELRGAGSKNI